MPIRDVLQRHLDTCHSLLEIGSGTGQHAVYLAYAFPHLRWQCTDLADNVEVLNRRLGDAELINLPQARPLDVNQDDWNLPGFDAIFTANSLHIMSAASVERFFMGLSRHLHENGRLFIYGPFKYQGEFTSESNARFDSWLRERDPTSGVRDFEWVCELAGDIGLALQEDNAMPANNQLLVWLSRQS